MCFSILSDRNTGSSRYIMINNGLSFHDAQSYCRMHHTDLASARDEEENAIVKQAVTSNTWIGLSRDLWKWSDQSNFSAIPWVSGKPWGMGKTDNCGKFINGQVDTAECSEIMPFFCLGSELKSCSG